MPPYIHAGRASVTTIVLTLLGLIIPGGSAAQPLGDPVVMAYSRTDYGAGAANWAIAQDRTGRLLVANGRGLLSAVGSKWELHPLPNRSVARSVFLGPKDRIYVGGQNEFGYFLPDSLGNLVFRDQASLIPAAFRSFADVWEIVGQDTAIFWRASGRIHRLARGKVSVFDRQEFRFLGEAAGIVYAQDITGAIWRWSRQKENPELVFRLPSRILITEVVGFPDGRTLFLSEADGIYQLTDQGIIPLDNQPAFLSGKDLSYALVPLGGGRMAIGSSYNGITILDDKGKAIQRIDIESGLPTNKVICLFPDRKGNLWAGLDNGLAQVLTQSRISRIVPDGPQEGAGFDCQEFGGFMYWATNNGVFRSPWKDGTDGNSFSMVPGTIGQAWGLDRVGDILFLGHNRGGFSIGPEGIINTFTTHGSWLGFADAKRPDITLLGTYQGVEESTGPGPAQTRPVGNFRESARFMVQDSDGSVWVSHPYLGIRRMSRGKDGTWQESAFGKKQGLPSDLNNYVFRINGATLFGTMDGIYAFKDSCSCFQRQDQWDRFLQPGKAVKRLTSSRRGDIWFVTDQEIGVLERQESGLTFSWRKTTFPEVFPQLNEGWENIHPIDDRRALIGTLSGFLSVDLGGLPSQEPGFEVLFTRVEQGSTTPTTLFGGHGNQGDPAPRIDVADPAIRFEYGATELEYPESVEYRWRLDGLSGDWSDWSSQGSREFIGLAPGRYVFIVQARSIRQVVREARFAFIVPVPWYRGTGMTLLYLAISLSLAVFLVRRNRRRIKDLTESYSSDVRRSRDEIRRLEEEKMRAELEHQQRELVSSTMHLVVKNETIASIRESLERIARETSDTRTRQALKEMDQVIGRDEHVDEAWDQILYHFNVLHSGFLDRLRAQFPDLNKNDIKLCVYLRMNISTKEISHIANTSVRGIEASRYRLRKKMGLDRQTDLVDFLMSL